MITVKNKNRFYDDYKINSNILPNGEFKYDLNKLNLEKIIAVLNKARYEFKQPCVAHLIIRH